MFEISDLRGPYALLYMSLSMIVIWFACTASHNILLPHKFSFNLAPYRAENDENLAEPKKVKATTRLSKPWEIAQELQKCTVDVT